MAYALRAIGKGQTFATSLPYGYDDANFWQNVIPAMHCPACGLNRAGKRRDA